MHMQNMHMRSVKYSFPCVLSLFPSSGSCFRGLPGTWFYLPGIEFPLFHGAQMEQFPSQGWCLASHPRSQIKLPLPGTFRESSGNLPGKFQNDFWIPAGMCSGVPAGLHMQRMYRETCKAAQKRHTSMETDAHESLSAALHSDLPDLASGAFREPLFLFREMLLAKI